MVVVACAVILASCTSSSPSVDVTKMSANAVAALVLRDLEARPYVSFSFGSNQTFVGRETIATNGDLKAIVHYASGGNLTYQVIRNVPYGKFDSKIATTEAANAIQNILGAHFTKNRVARLQLEINSSARKLANHWLRGNSVYVHSALTNIGQFVLAAAVLKYKAIWLEELKFGKFKKVGPIRFQGHKVIELVDFAGTNSPIVFYVSLGSDPVPVAVKFPKQTIWSFPGGFTIHFSWPLHESIAVPSGIVKPCSLLTPSDVEGTRFLGGPDNFGTSLKC